MSAAPVRRVAWLATPVLIALALAGCSTAASDTASSEAVTEGGNLTYAISTDGGCIDPQQVGNNDQIAIARQTVASLTIQDPESGEILPWVASSWDINDDASQYTFHLRSDAVYADGTPIDAESVKANFEAIVALGAKASLGSSYLGSLEGIDVIDAQTVEIDFDTPNIQFLQASSTFSLGLISTASTQLSVEDRCAGKYIGSGPFAVDSFVTSSQTVLKRVPDYDLGTAANNHTGAAYLDTITFLVEPETDVKVGSLQSDQIDATTGVPQNELSLFQTSDYSILDGSNPGIAFNLFPNLSSPILSGDPEILQAIQWAIDRSEITATVYGSDAKVVQGVLASSTPDFEAVDDEFGYDQAKAEQILDDDGWTVGSDGIREKNGTKLSLYLAFYQTQDPILVLQQELKDIGIDLQIKQVAISDLSAIRASGDYDFQYYNLTRADPDVLRTVFGFDYTNVNNRTSASDIDTLLDEQAGEPDATARTALITEIQQDLVTEGYAIPLYQVTTYLVTSNKVHDLKFEASVRLDFYDAWVSQ